MKTLIVYASAYGISKRISEKLCEDLGGDVALLNLRQDKAPQLSNYERIIIGSSVKSGKLEKAIYNFCSKHHNEMKELVLGLFVCSSETNEVDARQNLEAFPEQLLFSARSTAVFKAQLNVETSGFIRRLLVKNFTLKKNRSKLIDSEAVYQFSKRMDRILTHFCLLSNNAGKMG